MRRWNEASLAADVPATCALTDPTKLRYIKDIGLPCETVNSGPLTPESERDVRSRTITSIDITGDDAVAHTRGVDGERDLQFRRTNGVWLFSGV